MADTLIQLLIHGVEKLGLYAEAVRIYMHEVDDVGSRIYNTQWTNAKQQLDSSVAINGESTYQQLLLNADIWESRLSLLNAISAMALSPSVISAANTNMSRTYSENLHSQMRHIREFTRNSVSMINIMIAASATGKFFGAQINIDVLTTEFHAEVLHGAVATEIYVSALLYKATQGENSAITLLDVAKDTAFGIMPDSVSAAAADSEVLSEYHPLQVMTYTPIVATAGTGLAIDLGLPQSKIVALYNITPLIDRRSSGPIGSLSTGLNYRLVERLRTIRTVPRKKTDTFSDRGIQNGVLNITYDGESVLAMLANTTQWAPFSGSRPRVEAYNKAAATLIMSRIHDDHVNGWNHESTAKFETAAKDKRLPVSECNKHVLLAAFTAEFEKAYDFTPPKTVLDFHQLIAPDEFTPNTYICSAITRVAVDALETRFHAFHMIGMPRVPYTAAVREIRLTQMVYILDLSQSLWRQFRSLWYVDADAFMLTETRRRIVLMDIFRTIVSKVLDGDPIECAPASLKEFVVTMQRS